MPSLAWLVAIGAVASVCVRVAYADDVSLYDNSGKAVAYIDMDDDMTIYLWSGKPVAYLVADAAAAGEFAVYGFNGTHLGWFAQGVIWDHTGAASCADPDRMGARQSEPFKGFKEFKPFKAFREFAPLRPGFTNAFGDTQCEFLLASGAAE